MLDRIKSIVSRMQLSLFGQLFFIRVEADNEFVNGRIFLQITYNAPCTKTGSDNNWHGRKWYLSKHMTDDEIVKTTYAAFQACINHELMEGFKVDGITLFNPHVNFEELLKISNKEIKRK